MTHILILSDCYRKFEGGADTGFRRVDPREYQPRLLHLHGSRRRVDVREVCISDTIIHSFDILILLLTRTCQYCEIGSIAFDCGSYCYLTAPLSTSSSKIICSIKIPYYTTNHALHITFRWCAFS